MLPTPARGMRGLSQRRGIPGAMPPLPTRSGRNAGSTTMTDAGPDAPLPTGAGEDPLVLFGRWLRAAEASEPNDPEAMCLATADARGRPAARMVLLKEADARGFVFYSHRDGRKGLELDANPFAALCFHWKTLRRQVRVEGRVERVSDAESDAYYASRARVSRLGAWASRQSRPLADRVELEAGVAAAEARFPGDDVPRPQHWGGFRLVPDRVEFWRDMPHRLHDRLVFERAGDGWTTGRLFP